MRRDGFSFSASARSVLRGSKSPSSRQENGPRATHSEIVEEASEFESVLGGFKGNPCVGARRAKSYGVEVGNADDSVVHRALHAHNRAGEQRERGNGAEEQRHARFVLVLRLTDESKKENVESHVGVADRGDGLRVEVDFTAHADCGVDDVADLHHGNPHSKRRL